MANTSFQFPTIRPPKAEEEFGLEGGSIPSPVPDGPGLSGALGGGGGGLADGLGGMGEGGGLADALGGVGGGKAEEEFGGHVSGFTATPDGPGLSGALSPGDGGGGLAEELMGGSASPASPGIQASSVVPDPGVVGLGDVSGEVSGGVPGVQMSTSGDGGDGGAGGGEEEGFWEGYVQQASDLIDRQLAESREEGMKRLDERMAQRGLTGSSIGADQAAELEENLQTQRQQRMFGLEKFMKQMEQERELTTRGQDIQQQLADQDRRMQALRSILQALGAVGLGEFEDIFGEGGGSGGTGRTGGTGGGRHGNESNGGTAGSGQNNPWEEPGEEQEE